ncbi:MAG: dicarboxylate/amino acid:cation symporter [Akkermansiaceae bacterium]|nr:dicarboxylate/amino acid:cation symporter [Akkermansiaceae bacterium]
MKVKPHWQILAALVLATITAIVFRGIDATAPPDSTPAVFIGRVMAVAAFIGDLFMRALRMIIVPLIFSSVVAGIASLHGVKGFGRLFGKTAGFYALSSILAIVVGLTMVNLIQPGLEDGKPSVLIRDAFEAEASEASEEQIEKVESAKGRKGGDIWDFFKRMIPPNVIAAASDNGQLLGIIFFSILFAVAMTRLPKDEMSTLRQVFQSLNDAMIVVTRWIMAVAPIGVYGLILPVVFETGGELFLKLGKYFATVLGALAVHLFVVMPLILRLLGKVSPLAHFRAMRTALLTAFSTASSSATLPITMRCVQDNAGVSKRTASFTLPLGATVNMDGTALYECVAVLFVAQVMGIPMGVGAQFMVVVTALLTSVGVAGIPSASLVAIFIILKNSGIPGAEAAVVALLAVDRLLDMSRTAVNVFGDSCAAVVVARSEGEVGILEADRTSGPAATDSD